MYTSYNSVQNNYAKSEIHKHACTCSHAHDHEPECLAERLFWLSIIVKVTVRAHINILITKI